MQRRAVLGTVFSVIFLSLAAFPISHAGAAYDPCYSVESNVRSAQRNVQVAQNNAARAQSDLFRAQEQVASRTANYEAQVSQREANLNAVIASNVAWTASCVAQGFFFRYRFRSCTWVAAASVNRRARAQASLNTARSRLSIYQSYSATYLQRMAARVVLTEARLSQAQADLATAEAQYQQCISSQQ
jgi:multidrug efflux pump subunit AcrA (membrane-fusion protein)